MSAGPELSVVLATDSYETIAKVVSKMSAQSASRSIELVIVAPGSEHADVRRRELPGFHGVKLVDAPPYPLAWARAAGIRVAGAPLVAIGETHAYPEPGWAEALIEAHHGPWAVVASAVVNANPDSLISWASLFLDYGPWVDLAEGAPADYVPVHNSCFKRSVLLEYADGLDELLSMEQFLIRDLKSRGHRLYAEPAARTAHLNTSKPVAWLRERFYVGRGFAATRAAPWGRPRRLAFAAASPLIPVLRFRRTLPLLRDSRSARGLMPRVLPALLTSLAVSAFGELCGYAFGAGRSAPRCNEVEIHKARFVRQRPS
jgi:hypothetical protein